MRGLRLTLRHYYDFGTDRVVVGDDLMSPESWDGLRTRTSGVFSIPATREEFVRAAEERADLEARARAIDAWLEDQGAGAIASYGVGGAALEWWLHRLRPDRGLIVTDYGQATVERLGELFPEADARYHDLRGDGPVQADVHLFHRVDTELTDNEWPEVFARFAQARILLVAADVLDVRRLLFELRHRPLMKRRHATSAGFIRTRAALESLWRPTHADQAVRMRDLNAWALEPRRAQPSPAAAAAADATTPASSSDSSG